MWQPSRQGRGLTSQSLVPQYLTEVNKTGLGMGVGSTSSSDHEKRLCCSRSKVKLGSQSIGQVQWSPGSKTDPAELGTSTHTIELWLTGISLQNLHAAAGPIMRGCWWRLQVELAMTSKACWRTQGADTGHMSGGPKLQQVFSLKKPRKVMLRVNQKRKSWIRPAFDSLLHNTCASLKQISKRLEEQEVLFNVARELWDHTKSVQTIEEKSFPKTRIWP